MVKPFKFARVPHILFGTGSLSRLPDRAAALGRNIALVTGARSFTGSPYSQILLEGFKKRDIAFHLVTIGHEPSPEDIDEAVKDLGGSGVELVVGIGGGSVLDAGKAISAMMGREESVARFLEEVGDLEHPGTRLPYIAVPTTSGTGSEATKNAVISKPGINGFKKSLRHDNFVPDLALVDPELTLNCPRNITAASGMDCFTQLTEAYLSDNAAEYTDALAMEGLRAIKLSLTRSCYDGQDAEARTGMSFAALTSGICLANAGLGVVHGFASSLGGLFEVPHGLVCGTLMAKANEVTVRELRKQGGNQPSLRKYSTLGRLFTDEEGRSDDYCIDAFVEYLYSLTSDLGLPGLGSYGIGQKDIPAICGITGNKNNPVKLNTEQMAEIIGSRLI